MPQFTATSSIYWDGLLSLTISAFKHSAKLNWIKKKQPVNISEVHVFCLFMSFFHHFIRYIMG